MSKGLGKNYLTEQMVTWHLAKPVERQYCNLQDGKKISMPRYYKDKIFTEEQRKLANEAMALKAAKEIEMLYNEQPLVDHYHNQKQAKEAAYAKMLTENNKRDKI